MGNTVIAAEKVANDIVHPLIKEAEKIDLTQYHKPANHPISGDIPPECPMHQKIPPAPSKSECPIQHGKDDINPLNMMPAANQQPSPGQPFSLPTQRQTSTIPKVTADGTKEFWQYPSQQMFWNAMLRKGDTYFIIYTII